jgi:hypothetical protein
MKRTAPILTIALLAAGCGSSTTSNDGTTPGVDLTEPSDTTLPASDTTVVDTAPTTDDVPTTDSAVPVSEPPVTTAPVTESLPPATDAPAPDTTAAPAPPVSVAPTSETAVVYGGGNDGIPWAPLGWWDGSAWNPAGYAEDGSIIPVPAPTISSVAATSLDLPDGPGQVLTGLALGADDYYCVGDETGPLIDLGTTIPDTPVSLGYDALAVTADWPLQPRPVTQVGVENPEYQAVGAGLVDAPTAAAGLVSQVVRADLDGNGVEEVLVTYEYLTETNFGAENDFSAIYLRTPSADGSVTDRLVVEYVLGDPVDFPTVGRFTIAAVADLNGDGVMEVATRNQFWESAGITIWEFSDGVLSEIGGGGCGV